MTDQFTQKNMNQMDKKFKSASLDQKFPAGWLLIAIGVAVLVLQLISGWKILSLERERAYFVALQKKLPELEIKCQELEVRKIGLEKDINYLNQQKEALNHSLNEARETIAQRDVAQKQYVEATQGFNKTITENEKLRKTNIDLQDQINKKENEIKDLKGDIDRINQQTKEADAKYQMKEGQVNAKDIELTKLSTQYDTKLEELKKLTSQNKQIEKATINLNDVAKKLSSSQNNMDGSIDKLNGSIKAFSSNLQNISRDSATIASENNTLSEAVKEFTQLKQDVQQKSKDSIQEIDKSAKTINSKATEMANMADSINTKISNLSNSVSATENSAKEFSSKMQLDLEQNSKTVSSKITEMSNSINDINNIIKKLSSALGDTELNTKELNAKIQSTNLAQAKVNIDNLAQQINFVITKITNDIIPSMKTLEGKISTLYNDTNTKQQVPNNPNQN